MRVSAETLELIGELKKETGAPAWEIVEEAIDALWSRIFLDAVNRGYAELQRDPARRKQAEEERARRNARVRKQLRQSSESEEPARTQASAR